MVRGDKSPSYQGRMAAGGSHGSRLKMLRNHMSIYIQETESDLELGQGYELSKPIPLIDFFWQSCTSLKPT